MLSIVAVSDDSEDLHYGFLFMVFMVIIFAVQFTLRLYDMSLFESLLLSICHESNFNNVCLSKRHFRPFFKQIAISNM